MHCLFSPRPRDLPEESHKVETRREDEASVSHYCCNLHCRVFCKLVILYSQSTEYAFDFYRVVNCHFNHGADACVYPNLSWMLSCSSPLPLFYSFLSFNEMMSISTKACLLAQRLLNLGVVDEIATRS